MPQDAVETALNRLNAMRFLAILLSQGSPPNARCAALSLPSASVGASTRGRMRSIVF